MTQKAIDLSRISKPELIQAIGDQRAAIMVLQERLNHAHTISLELRAILPRQRRLLATLTAITQTSNPSHDSHEISDSE